MRVDREKVLRLASQRGRESVPPMRVLGWVYVLIGALGVTFGLAGLGGAGLLLSILAASVLVVGWGLLARRSWAYLTAVILALSGVMISSTWMLLGSAMAAAALLVSAAILFYLWSPVGRDPRRPSHRTHRRER